VRRPVALDPGAPESDRLPDAPHPRETFSLYGQGRAEATLLDAYRSGRLPHAWILGGAQGIGKATLAWRFARFVLTHPDPGAPAVAAARDLSVDVADPVAQRVARRAHGDVALLRREWSDKNKRHFTDIRVDDVREAQTLFQRSAAAQGYRIAIVDAADDLNANAANALLKLIEEPPARSLFLIVAHRPGLVMPTIRSRCARLLLDPLAPHDVAAAIRDMGEPWSEHEEAALAEAAAHCDGSLRRALSSLDPQAQGFAGGVEAMLASLPRVDLAQAHRLADLVAARGAEQRFATLVDTVQRWLDDRLRRPGVTPRALAPYAAVWEKLRAAAAEAEAYNLDRRPLVLSLVRDLAEAEQRAIG
jgi:DNA polymerase-3 subunit delta'